MNSLLFPNELYNLRLNPPAARTELINLNQTVELLSKLANRDQRIDVQVVGLNEIRMKFNLPSQVKPDQQLKDAACSFAQNLSLYTGCQIVFVKAQGDFIFEQKISGLRIELANTYPNTQAQDCLIDLALEFLYNQRSKATSADGLQSTIEQIFAKYSDRNQIKAYQLGNDLLGETSLSITLPYSLITSSEFHAFLMRVKSAGVEVVKLIPDRDSALNIIKLQLANSMAWQLTLSKKNHEIHLNIPKNGDAAGKPNLAPLVLLAQAQGCQLKVFELDSDKEQVLYLPPQERGPAFDNFLADQKQELENSNITEYHYKFIPGKHTLKFIAKNFIDPVLFTAHSFGPDNNLDVDQLSTWIETVSASLGFQTGKINLKHNLTINLTKQKLDIDHDNILVLKELVNAINSTYQSKISLNFSFVHADYLNFLFQRTPANIDWSLNRTNVFRLSSREPQKLDKEMVSDFLLCFGENLVIERLRTKSSGLKLNTHLELDSPSSLEQVNFHLTSVKSTLPIGFGVDPGESVKLDGNRFVIYSRILNLPKAYLEYYQQRLYAVCLPVYVEEEHLAERCKDLEILKDIVRNSLPTKTFLHKITETEDAFILTIYGNKLLNELEAWHTEICLCASKPIRLEIHQPSNALTELLENAPLLNYKHFLAAIIGPDYQCDPTEVDRLYNTLVNLSFNSDGGGQKINKTSNSANRIVDNAFSMDPEFTILIEDAFSVTKLSGPEAGYEIGIHIVNVAQMVKFGSVADITAYMKQSKTYANDEQHRDTAAMLPREILKHTSFNGTTTPALSLFFDLDRDYKFNSKNPLRLGFSDVKNTQNYRMADDAPVPADLKERLFVLHKFIKNHPISSSAASITVSPKDITFYLLKIFNNEMSKLLTEQNIPVPQQDNGLIKFNTGAREFIALVAQRQLLAYMKKTKPLSESQILELTKGCKNIRNQQEFFEILFRLMQDIKSGRYQSL